jgi:hypothetical protein
MYRMEKSSCRGAKHFDIDTSSVLETKIYPPYVHFVEIVELKLAALLCDLLRAVDCMPAYYSCGIRKRHDRVLK